MYFPDVCGHVGEAVFAHLPVAGVGISAVVVVGLPAIVDDDGLHAECSGLAAFFLDRLSENILMELIPRRVQGVEGRIGGLDGFNTTLRRHPVDSVTDSVAPEYRAFVENYPGGVAVDRRFGLLEISHASIEHTVLLAEADGTVDFAETFACGDGESVCVVVVEESEDGHVGCQVRAVIHAPVGFDLATVVLLHSPDVGSTDLGSAYVESELRRRLRRGGFHADCDYFFAVGFGNAEVKGPVAGFVARQGNFSDEPAADGFFEGGYVLQGS